MAGGSGDIDMSGRTEPSMSARMTYWILVAVALLLVALLGYVRDGTVPLTLMKVLFGLALLAARKFADGMVS
jgi:hypothetical protein